MAIEFGCSSCGKTVRVADSAAGKKGKCPHCATVLQIPAAAPASAAAPANMPNLAGAPAAPKPPTLSFPCPGCGQTMRAPATMAGKKGKCPHCQTAFVVGGGAIGGAPAAPQANPAELAPLGGLTPLGAGDLQLLDGPAAAGGGGFAPLAGGNDLFASLPPASTLAPAPLPSAPSPLGYRPSPTANPFADHNPYPAPNPSAASPYGAAPAQYGRPTMAPVKLMIPAIALILFAVISMGFYVLNSIVQLTDPNPPVFGNGDPQTSIVAYRFGTVAALIAALAINGAVIAGAIQMIRLKGYDLAKGGAMAALIPCCSAFCINIPFGIWALIVLNQPDVKRMFS
jgi:predicted RNA-binding Zn-ribbon protein involved in translation (DUF1610 family)